MSFLETYNKNIEIKISLISIAIVGLILRLYYFPYDLPLFADGLDNFTYATAINYYNHLPNEWSPANNGWPIFLSFWFSLFRFENTFEYMQLQKIISVILSITTIVPIYLLCRKFFDKKLALIGSALFIFDPRIILNSTLGITEPLFILLGISSLLIFLRYDRKSIVFAFIFASFATIVRSEGIFLLITLAILFIIKYKISKEIFKTFIPALVLFMLILTPIMIYKTEVSGHDGIFERAVYGTGEIINISNQKDKNELISGIELFMKYLGWIMIPTFLFFVPLGLFLFLKNRKKETYFIIVFLISSSLPILYACIVQAQDTRYFYFLYPIFCLISLFGVEFYLKKINKNNNIIILLLIIGIFSSSVIFYEYKKIDFEKEREWNDISKIISSKISGTNFHPDMTKYIRDKEIPKEWPFLFNEMYRVNSIPMNSYNNIVEYIQESRSTISHLVISDNLELPKFLIDVYHNESKYSFLEKEFDSEQMGFKNGVKLFKIDFQKFDLFVNDNK